MAYGQGYVKVDQGIYAGIQSAKGTPQTTLKGANGFTSAAVVPESEAADAEPFLGGGFYLQKKLPWGIKVQINAEGWCTLGTFPGFLFAGFATKGTTTGAGPNYSTPYTMITRNANKKYLTMAVVYGESAAGSGIQTIVVRDCVLTSFSLDFNTKGPLKWQATWTGLNMGPGAGSETYAFDSTFNIANPSNSATVLTLPGAIFGANICANNAGIKWNANTVQSDPCFGTPEHADTLIVSAAWEVSFGFQYDSNMVSALNQLWYGTGSPTAGSGDLVAAFKEGQYSFVASSDNFITGSIPWSLTWTWPSLQWAKPQVTADNPLKVTLMANSFGSDATMTLVNDKTSANMTF